MKKILNPSKTELLSILIIFLVLRVSLSILVYYVVARDNLSYASSFNLDVYEYVLEKDPQIGGIASTLFSGWLRWDTKYFIKIAISGYEIGDGTTAFGILYPLLIRTVATTIGGGNFLASALLISSFFAFLAMTLFFHAANSELKNRKLALRSMMLYLGFPTAFFLFAAYPESLFFSLVFASWISVKHKHWLFAGILAGLSVLVRFQGVTLSVMLGIYWFYEQPLNGSPHNKQNKQTSFFQELIYRIKNIKMDAKLLFCAIPILVYMIFHLWVSKQFSSVSLDSYETYWQNPILAPWTALYYLGVRLSNGGLFLLDYINIFVFGLTFALGIFSIKRLHPALVFYSFVTMFITAWLSLGRLKVFPITGEVLTSYSRYALSLFPLFFVLTDWLRSKWVYLFWLAISFIFQAMLLFGFTHWVFIA